MLEYVESYQFKRNGRHGLGSRLRGNKLQGKIRWGRYTTRGNKIIPLSGELKQDHYYMVITKHSHELVLMHSTGKPTGIGCYLHQP